jgi:hypothetical protein
LRKASASNKLVRKEFPMDKFYCDDKYGGERTVYETEAEALEDASTAIAYHRREANNDGEWGLDHGDITVGIVAESGDPDDDIATHRCVFVGDDEEGYDCSIKAFDTEPAVSTVIAPAAT